MEKNSDGEYVKYSDVENFLYNVEDVKEKTRKVGHRTMSISEFVSYRQAVYEYYFYNDKKWTFDGQSVFFNGHSIHYSDFMKAKRGNL